MPSQIKPFIKMSQVGKKVNYFQEKEQNEGVVRHIYTHTTTLYIKCMIHASSAIVSYSSFVILISSDLCVHFVGLHGPWLIKLFGQFFSHILDPLCK